MFVPEPRCSIGNEEVVVTAPTWRGDVVAEIDVIEEVARLHGYDAFSDRAASVPRRRRFRMRRSSFSTTAIQDALAAEGLFEVRPLPFVAGSTTRTCASRIRSPRTKRISVRRFSNRSRVEPSSTCRTWKATFACSRSAPSSRRVTASTLPLERRSVGVLIMGDRRPSHFTEPKPPRYDQWDARALAERLVEIAAPGADADARCGRRRRAGEGRASGRSSSTVQRAASCARSRSTRQCGPRRRTASSSISARSTRLTSRLRASRFMDRRRAAAAGAAHVQFKPLPSTPAAPIDLALLVPDAVRAAEVERVIRNNGGDLLERLTLFDEFRGAGLPAGTRSLAWRLTFRDATRTLRDKEIEGRTNKILRALEGELGVRQRSA